MIKVHELHLSLIFFILLTTSLIIYRGKLNALIQLVTLPDWILSFLVIIIWCLYIFKFNAFNIFNKQPDELKNFRRATTHAIIALIIALFTHLGLTIPTFWFVLIVAYFLEAPLLGIY